MYEDDFAPRLAKLRANKGVSAREMSLSVGQNAGYISNIECGKALPSMSGFFFICEYLNISPRDFFDLDNPNPSEIQELLKMLKQLDAEELKALSVVVRGLTDRRQ